MSELKIAVNDVLETIPVLLEQRGMEFGEDALKLAKQADALIKPILALDGINKARGIESVGHGLKSGLAAIANEQARNFLDDLITNTLKFAKTIGRAWGLPI